MEFGTFFFFFFYTNKGFWDIPVMKSYGILMALKLVAIFKRRRMDG